MCIGVEDGLMSGVFSLEVPGLFSISVTAHEIPGYFALISGAFASVFPGFTYVFPVRFSIGSTIYVLK